MASTGSNRQEIWAPETLHRDKVSLFVLTGGMFASYGLYSYSLREVVMESFDAIVVGGRHNGILPAANYLAEGACASACSSEDP